MCGRYYIPEEDSAEELRAIIDEVNRKNKGAPIKKGEIRPTDVAPVRMRILPYCMDYQRTLYRLLIVLFTIA